MLIVAGRRSPSSAAGDADYAGCCRVKGMVVVFICSDRPQEPFTKA
jgi:hypothetical protein